MTIILVRCTLSAMIEAGPNHLNPEKRTIGETFVISIEGEKHPNEDRYFASNHVFVVTDGVSRTKPEGGTYPNPSGAAMAAEAVAETAGEFLSTQTIYTPEVLLEALRRGNDAVMELNVANDIIPGKKLDYRVHDYYNTCAAVAVIHDGVLHWATIGDTQIAVFGIQDFPALITENTVLPLERYRDGRVFPSTNERLAFWREHLRNKPHAQYQTYGTLTGEWEAMAYVKTGSRPMFRGDLVVLFSDGLVQHVMDATFRELLRKNPSEEDVMQFIKTYRKNYTDEHNGNDLPNGHDDKTLIAVTIT